MMDRELWLTALHEAGHAVAFRRRFPDAAISYGRVALCFDGGGYSQTVPIEKTDCERAADDPVVLAAGYAGVRAAGHPEDVAIFGCDGDDPRLDFPRLRAAGASVEEAKAAALALLSTPENLRAVALAADALLTRRQLDEEQLDLILGAASAAEAESALWALDERREYWAQRRIADQQGRYDDAPDEPPYVTELT